MAATATRQKRQETTGPGLIGGMTFGLVGRVRAALGGHDHRAEVAGYRIVLRDAGPSQVGVIVDRLLNWPRRRPRLMR